MAPWLIITYIFTWFYPQAEAQTRTQRVEVEPTVNVSCFLPNYEFTASSIPNAPTFVIMQEPIMHFRIPSLGISNPKPTDNKP